MKFAALGRTRWLLDSISSALAQGHECVLIATADAAPEYGVGKKDFASTAASIGCPFIFDAKIDKPDHLKVFEQSGADIAISVNWPILIKQTIRDCFRHGVLNAHAGDLPRFRGNACPNWAILNGEKEVVITIHEMVDELDAGRILLQDRLSLTESTYIGDIYRWLDFNIPRLFSKVLNDLEAGTLRPRHQPADPSLSLRCYPRRPEDGLINWSQPAMNIARLVRASAEPFAGAYTYLDMRKLIIWRAHPERLVHPHLGIPGQVVRIGRQSGEVLVLSGENLLVLEEVEIENVGRVRSSAAIKSTRIRLGMDGVGEILQLQDRVKRLEDMVQQYLPK